MHDEVVLTVAQKYKNGQNGRSHIYTDTPGMRSTENKHRTNWTKDATHIDHEPDIMGITSEEEIDSSDEEAQRHRIYTYQTPQNENVDEDVESETESDTEPDNNESDSEPESDTTKGPNGQPNPRTPNSTKHKPFTFRHEFAPDKINEPDPYKRHYKLEGSRHFFKTSALALDAPGGEYMLYSLSTDTTKHAIWALFQLLRPDITKKEAEQDPLPDPTAGLPEDHKLDEHSYETEWRHIRRNPSRTIPIEIDPDADLNPDFFILKGLPEDAPIPTKPTKAFTIQIADALTGREGEPGSTEESMEAAGTDKIRKYTALINILRNMGYRVDTTVHIIAAGIRGGIPNITTKTLEKLNFAPHTAKQLGQRISTITATRLGWNLILSRMLEHLPENSHRSAVAQKIWKNMPKKNQNGKPTTPRDPG